jgi:hypothetical protein
MWIKLSFERELFCRLKPTIENLEYLASILEAVEEFDEAVEYRKKII